MYVAFVMTGVFLWAFGQEALFKEKFDKSEFLVRLFVLLVAAFFVFFLGLEVGDWITQS